MTLLQINNIISNHISNENNIFNKIITYYKLSYDELGLHGYTIRLHEEQVEII